MVTFSTYDFNHRFLCQRLPAAAGCVVVSSLRLDIHDVKLWFDRC